MNEQDIFCSALEIEDPSAREQYLQDACGGNAELMEQVQALLLSHQNASAFLDTPAVQQIAAGSSDGIDATILQGARTTLGDEARAPDEEIPLGYLQPTSQPDSLGRLGHYEILEVIGRGAFGTVLRAKDEKLQRVVAIKVLAPEMAATSPARKRFLREAQSSAAVRHENVVSIYAVEDHPIPYLVMEYIPGKTLQQRLDEQGPLDLADVLRLGKQIADGLAAAHAEGLIHRDVKPGNILLEGGTNERVKITDFGLARTADDASMTQSGMIAGTPLYMAPEQAHGKKLDQRADLFSLGSVLYQMLSGRPPFRAPSTIAVLKRVTEDTPRPIQDIIPEAPDWMCELIGHLHAKNPDERFQSAKEVSDLLAQCAIDLKEGRIPEVPDPTEGASRVAEKSADVVTRAVRPRRSPSLLHNPLLKVAAVVLILLGALGITEVNGVTDITGRVLKVIINVDKGSDVTILVQPKGEAPKRIIPEGERESENPPLPTPDPLPPQRIAGPWPRQVEEVRQKLKARNPGFDETTLAYEIDEKNGVVVKVSFPSDYVTDISPLRELPGLESLDCSSSWSDYYYDKAGVSPWGVRYGDKENLSPLSDLSSLKELSLNSLTCNGTNVSDLSFLRGMPLEHLALAHTPVEDLSAIDPQRLKSLNVEGTQVSDADLAPFRGCRNITSLVLRNCAIGDAGLANFHGCKGLTRLVLGGTQVTDTGLALFRDCTQLTVLDLSGTQVTDRGLAYFEDCKNLTELYLGNTGVSDVGLAFFHGRENWTALDLSGTAITDKGLALYFANCQNLTLLDLSNTSLSDAGFEHFKRCRKLKFLTLYGTKVTDKGLSYFKDSKDLEVLVLRRSGKVTDAGMAHFRDFRKLKFLDLGLTNVGDAGLACFKDCESLTGIRLGGNYRFTDAGLAHFAKWKKLTFIESAWTHLGDAGLAHLKDFRNLRHLSVARSLVGDAGLAHVVENCPNLTDLGLEGAPQVTDLSLLKRLPLKSLRCDFLPDRDTEILRSIKTLETINGIPADEFWKEVEAEGIDVIALVDPQIDNKVEWITTKNEWQCKDGELRVGHADDGVHKLIFPIDSAWSAYEFEFEFTRYQGSTGFAVNIPTQRKDCPLFFDWSGKAGFWIGNPFTKLPANAAVNIAEQSQIENGKPTTLRIRVRRGEDGLDDHVTLWRNGQQVSQWNGDCNALALDKDEGYPHSRRSSIYIPGGNDFVFHKIRLHMLDGGTATTIRPLPAELQVEEVRKELKRLNPGFDETTLKHKIEDGVVVELSFLSDHVTDVSPVAKLTGLKSLDLSGSWDERSFTYRKSGLSQLADLSPLRGLPLTRLECNATEVEDLSPLQGMPLEHLSLAVTPVKDLSPVDPESLTHLNLGRTQVTDATLSHFEGCRNLTWLSLDQDTAVSDAGLAHFQDCKNLTWLGLSGNKKVTDAGLASFQDCTKLTTLGLSATQVTDKGLAYFKDCRNLSALWLGSCENVSDAGLAHFQDCKGWTALGLGGTGVTDEGLALYFRDFTQLTWLGLRGTEITDAGLAHFKDCKFLTLLDVRDTQVSDAGLAYFKDCQTLKMINGKPVAEFWKDVDQNQAGNDTVE